MKYKHKTYMMIVKEVMQYKLPENLIIYLMRENLIDLNLANEWVFEYRKFILIHRILNESVSPSEQVD